MCNSSLPKPSELQEDGNHDYDLGNKGNSVREEPIADGLGAPGDEDDFDPAAPLPFRYAELRAAIPAHCWVRDPWRSLRYVAADATAVAILAAAAIYLDSWFFWPFYWFAQGTVFWAIFFIGHDCIHGAFAESRKLSNLVGHFLHTFLLVPHHGWRISHRSHHQNHGHADKDESWAPVSETAYRDMNIIVRLVRFTVPPFLFIWPVYLWHGKLGAQPRSQFNPYSTLFHPSERKDVAISTTLWTLMVAMLVKASSAFGFHQVLKFYLIPYLVFVVWLDFVTYMQHHGYHEKLPRFRGKEWNYLRGALATIDIDYGWFNGIINNSGVHVVHHLFPLIPHYHLIESTEAVKPILGKYYRELKSSGPIPWYLIPLLLKSVRRDNFVSDTGDVVYYQTDPYLYKVFPWQKKTN